jgi:hypothetical protein
MHENGSDAPGPAGKNRADLEASAVHCPARNASAVASSRLQTLLEVQVEGSFSQAKDLC